MLELSLFGPFGAVWAGRPLPIGTMAARVALAVLALEPGRSRPRGELARMLWPEQSQSVASTNLRQVVARLRRALPDPDAAVVVSRETLALGEAVRSDVATLTALLAECGRHQHSDPGRCADCARRREQAAALYRGEFGADLVSGGSAMVEDWLLLTRERWHRQAVALLHELGLDQAAAGAYEAALATAERTLQLEPWREEAHRQAMVALAALGDRHAALDQYRRCAAVLGAELGITPDAATTALRDRIAARAGLPGSATPPRSSAPARRWAVPLSAQVGAYATALVPLVGRDAEWAELQGARKAAGQDCRVVLVSGEPGVGKTRLCSALAHRAYDDGAVALFGRCDEDLRVPYQPWVQALGHLVEHAGEDVLAALGPQQFAHLARLLPAAPDRTPAVMHRGPVDADTERYLLFQAVVDLLRAVGAARPVVIVLDDLQWADESTLLLLRHVVSASAQLPLLIVGAYRDSDLSTDHPLTAALAGLYRDGRLQRLRLSGLADTGILSLMENLAGHALDEDGLRLSRAIRQETGGNPFFTVEILRHLLESNIIQRGDDGRWRVREAMAQVSLPESVRAVVGRRVANLGADVHRCLSAASVIGREFDLRLLAAVLRQSEDDVLDLLEVAVAAAVVEEIPDGDDCYAFTHALMQHTLHDDLGEGRRRRLHRRVAEALEQECGDDVGDRVGELAAHWLAATVPVEAEKALRYARSAGERALARLAPDEAVRWFTQAVQLLPHVPAVAEAVHIDLLIELGTAQRQAAIPAYRETLLQAAALPRPPDRADQLVAAALANNRGYWSAVGELDSERVAVLQAALDALPERDSPDRALLLATLAAELSFARDWPTRRSLAAQSLDMTRRLGDPSTRAQVLNLTFPATNVPETLPDRLSRTAEAEDLAGESDDPVTSFWAATFRAYASLQACHLPEVDRCLARADALASRLRQPLLRYWSMTNASWRALLAGRTEEAERLAELAYELAPESSIPEARTNYVAQMRVIRHHQGRLDEMVETTADTVANNPGMPGLRGSLATVYCELDRDEEARALLRSDLASGFADVPYDPLWLNTWYRWAEVCAHLHEHAAAELLYERLAPWPDQVTFINVSIGGPVSYALGRLAALLDRPAEAHEHFAHAAIACESLQSPYLSACNDLARGEFEGAPDLVRRALATAERQGYATLERRSLALLTRIGSRK